MKNNSLKALAAIAGLTIFTTGAEAGINIGDSLIVSDAPGNYTGPIVSGLYQIGYVNNGQGGAATLECYAGPFNVVVNDTTQGHTYDMLTFCTDVGVDWNNSPTAYTARTFAAPSDGVSPPWSAVPQAIQNVAYLYNNIFLPLEAANQLTANNSAAIQLAIWKVLYDTTSSGLLDSMNFTTGEFRASGFAAITQADTYLTDVENARNGPSFPIYTETWLDPNGANSQGLICAPVPEPTTLIAGGLLLMPFGASVVRGLRKKSGA